MARGAVRAPSFYKGATVRSNRAGRSEYMRSSNSVALLARQAAFALLLFPILASETGAKATEASKCPNWESLRELTQGYIKFRNADRFLRREFFTHKAALNDDIRADLESKNKLFCESLGYVFFYGKFQCLIDSIDVGDDADDKYLAYKSGNLIPDGFRMIAMDIRIVVDDWFDFHHYPNFYKLTLPKDLDSEPYSPVVDRGSWASRQIEDAKKNRICLAYVSFVLGVNR
jgi:hypothetical protein